VKSELRRPAKAAGGVRGSGLGNEFGEEERRPEDQSGAHEIDVVNDIDEIALCHQSL
jgi:hypothetical protein